MRKWMLASLGLLLLVSLGASAAHADGLVPGYTQYASYTEGTNGVVTGPITICCELAGVTFNVASDGEGGFDPFNAGYDTSDGIQFANLGNFTVTSLNTAWNAVASTVGPTWVFPAVSPTCGNENEPTCEPTGIFDINTSWSGTPSYIVIYDATGAISDIITGDSNGPNGTFELKFYSDPNLPVPEPGTLMLFGVAAGVALVLKRRALLA
jgi:hypothetical protein